MGNKKITIMHVLDGLGLGGIERVAQEFALNSNKSQFNVFVGAYNTSGPRKKIIEDAGVKVIKLSKSNISQNLEKYKIDIVHLHNRQVDDFIGKTKIIKETIFSSNFSKDADINLIISKTLFYKMNKYFNLKFGKNFYILYNPQSYVGWKKQKSNKKEIVQFRKRLGLHEKDLVLGRLGRAEPSKTDFLLLKSTPLIAKKIDNVKFVFFGLPILYRWLLSLRRCLRGKVIFLPETSNDRKIAKFYQSIDIFWHTASKGETFGNVNCEAMIFKKPVITHSTPFNWFNKNRRDNAQIEVVDHGKTGLIATYPKEIVSAVKFFKKNPKKITEYGNAGFDKVMEKYDAKVSTRELEKIIINVVRGTKNQVKPNAKELHNYLKSEYSKRLASIQSKTSKLEQLIYHLEKGTYKLVELAYLMFRKIVRQTLKKDIEKTDWELIKL